MATPLRSHLIERAVAPVHEPVRQARVLPTRTVPTKLGEATLTGGATGGAVVGGAVVVGGVVVGGAVVGGTTTVGLEVNVAESILANEFPGVVHVIVFWNSSKITLPKLFTHWIRTS